MTNLEQLVLIQNNSNCILCQIIDCDNKERIGKKAILSNNLDVLFSQLKDEKEIGLFKHLIHNYVGNNFAGTIKDVISSTNTNYEIYFERYSSAPRIIAFGGGHLAVPLMKLSKLLEFDFIVVDDRYEFANNERFPEADQVLNIPFTELNENLEFKPNDYLVVITRGHMHDTDVLEQVWDKEVKYIGLIGSANRVAALKEMMKRKGLTVKNDLYTPIGLNIGGSTLGEICVSIMSEIIAVKNDKIKLFAEK